ncbi:AbrB family transcriptional regulator [Halobacillus fulvus]|nr:AbrB family transcriptional regulator [Halobacillus fulvus]
MRRDGMPFFRMMFTYAIAALSGWVFALLHIPLPWILGPVVGLFLYKWSSSHHTYQLASARNIAFGLLGIQIGLTFSKQTFTLVVPYFVPYTILSFVIIILSLGIAYLISRRTKIDTKTSLIGSAPGGLSAMIAVSESFKGNTVLVTIFHTIRLLAVLFIIPFLATRWLYAPHEGMSTTPSTDNGPMWTIFLYGIVFIWGYALQRVLPASLVIVPMLAVGMMKALGFPLYELPSEVFILAQILIGVHLGQAINVDDLKKAGKYCLYYLGLSIAVIIVSIGLGFLLANWTGMDVVTAVLALAPGGLVEMAITAQDAGGQPAVVSSLQTIRLLTIVLVLPLLFKWLLPKV